MKTTSQIAKECGVGGNVIRNIADNEKFILQKIKGVFHYTRLQEERIHQVLNPKFITIESKMNIL